MDFFRSINSGRFLAIESNDKPANTIIKSPHVLAYQFNWDWTQLVPRCNIKKVEVEVSAWSPGEKNQETKGNHLTLVLQVEECPCAEVRITAVPDPSRSPLVELEDGVVGWKGHVKIMFSKHEGANEMYTPDRPVFKKISLPMPARRASQSLAPTTTTTTTSYRPPPPPQPTMTAATATTTTTTTPTPAVRGVGCSYHPARYSGGIETDRKGFPLSTVIDLIISCGLDQYEFYEDVTNNRSWMWALVCVMGKHGCLDVTQEGWNKVCDGIFRDWPGGMNDGNLGDIPHPDDGDPGSGWCRDCWLEPAETMCESCSSKICN